MAAIRTRPEDALMHREISGYRKDYICWTAVIELHVFGSVHLRERWKNE